MISDGIGYMYIQANCCNYTAIKDGFSIKKSRINGDLEVDPIQIKK